MSKTEVMTVSNVKVGACPGPGCNGHLPRGIGSTGTWFFLKVTGREHGRKRHTVFQTLIAWVGPKAAENEAGSMSSEAGESGHG